MNTERSKWLNEASRMISDCYIAAGPYIGAESTSLDSYVQTVSSRLLLDCHLTGESVLFLLAKRKEWDADLLSRAVFEGSLKLIYMLTGDEESRIRKAKEYWSTLPRLAERTRSRMAREFLALLPDEGGPEWQPIRDILLSAEENEKLSCGLNRKQRQKLKSSWSFTGICDQFASASDPGLRLLVHMAYNYGMSSHLVHKDGDGAGMVWERSQRPTEAREVVSAAHAARVASDQCTMAEQRLYWLLRACEADTEVVVEIQSTYSSLKDALRSATDEFVRYEYGSDET